MQPKLKPSSSHQRTLRHLLSHFAKSTKLIEQSLGPVALDAPVHDFCWSSAHSFDTTPQVPLRNDLPIFARVVTDDFFRLSLQSCVTYRGLPLIVFPSSHGDLFHKLVWIKKCRFIPSMGGWTVCADQCDITSFPDMDKAAPNPTPTCKPSPFQLSAIVRASSQIVFHGVNSALFLAELTYLRGDSTTASNRNVLRPLHSHDDTCVLLCIGEAAKWWPRMSQGRQVLITALKPMATRAKFFVLQTTANSKLTVDMDCSAPPAKRRKCTVTASAGAPSKDMLATRINRNLFDLISYQGRVTHASRREVVLDGIVKLPLSSQLGSSLYLFQVGNRLEFSSVLAVPAFGSFITIIPTIRTIIMLLHVDVASQNAPSTYLSALENQSLPRVKSRDHFIWMYWQRCIYDKLHRMLSSLGSDRADSKSSCPRDLDLLFTGSDGSSGLLRLLHKFCELPESKDVFADILVNFLKPLSLFEEAIPISIPPLQEVVDSCLKASDEVCKDNTHCIELFQGYSGGTLPSGQRFRFNWTDSTVPSTFLSPKSACLLVGLLRSSKYADVYTLSDDSGAITLRCYDRIPLHCIGAIVALKRYRIIANSWKRDVLLLCKRADIQILINGPNFASPVARETTHPLSTSSKQVCNKQREIRVSQSLCTLETITHHGDITDKTSMACMVAQKVTSRKSQTCVTGFAIAKKAKEKAWLYCADDACKEQVEVLFSDAYSARVGGMVRSGDIFAMSYVWVRECERSGGMIWKLDDKRPYMRVMELQSGCEGLLPDWVIRRMNEDGDVERMIRECCERCDGVVCDPLWMAQDVTEWGGSDVVSVLGRVVDTVSEGREDGPMVRLRDCVLGIVGIDICVGWGTSVVGLSRGLGVKVVGVRRVGEDGGGVCFSGTRGTRIEVVEDEGWKGERDVTTLGRAGKWFPYGCFPDGRVKQERGLLFPRMVTVRYRSVVGLARCQVGGDEVRSWCEWETEGSCGSEGDVVMRVDDGTRVFDLVVDGDNGMSVGGVGRGPVGVVYEVCGKRYDGDDGGSGGAFYEDGSSGSFEWMQVQLKRHVNLWTCVARPSVRARRLFEEADQRCATLSMARYMASLLENDQWP